MLVSHPTPPVFDGEEDRNGTRNADEIRLWAEYMAGEDTSWIVDDAGVTGGLDGRRRIRDPGRPEQRPGRWRFVEGAIQQLLDLDRVQDPAPTSDGAVEAATAQGQLNAEQEGDPALDTADFTDDAPGNLRADYVLPSAGFEVVDAGGVLAAVRRPAVGAHRRIPVPELGPPPRLDRSDVDVDLAQLPAPGPTGRSGPDASGPDEGYGPHRVPGPAGRPV